MVESAPWVCGIPLVLLSRHEQRRFIDAIEAVAPGRGFLHFSYCVTSPLPARQHRLAARREAWTPLNFPPPAFGATPRRPEGLDRPTGAGVAVF
jgi:phospholipid N-methyltransferase